MVASHDVLFEKINFHVSFRYLAIATAAVALQFSPKPTFVQQKQIVLAQLQDKIPEREREQEKRWVFRVHVVANETAIFASFFNLHN